MIGALTMGDHCPLVDHVTNSYIAHYIKPNKKAITLNKSDKVNVDGQKSSSNLTSLNP